MFERGPLDERAVQVADDRAAVVAEDVEDQRVVELADLLDALRPAGRLRSPRAPSASRRPPSAGRRPSSRSAERLVPLLHRIGIRRELGARRNDAHLDLPREDLLAHLVPALVELALVEILLEPARPAACAADGWRSGRSTS